jgi:hypothetical protein
MSLDGNITNMAAMRISDMRAIIAPLKCVC